MITWLNSSPPFLSEIPIQLFPWKTSRNQLISSIKSKRPRDDLCLRITRGICPNASQSHAGLKPFELCESRNYPCNSGFPGLFVCSFCSFRKERTEVHNNVCFRFSEQKTFSFKMSVFGPLSTMQVGAPYYAHIFDVVEMGWDAVIHCQLPQSLVGLGRQITKPEQRSLPACLFTLLSTWVFVDSVCLCCSSQDLYLNMPFQSWELRPHAVNSCLFTVIAAIVELEIEIKVHVLPTTHCGHTSSYP